jgi:hypothetical protein
MNWTEEQLAAVYANRGTQAPPLPPSTKAKGKQGHTPGQMNRTEERKLAGELEWYAFEGITFRLGPDARYTPDYAAMDRKTREITFYEVKGTKQGKAFHRDPQGRTKLAIASEMYPQFHWVLTWRLSNGEWAQKEYGA